MVSLNPISYFSGYTANPSQISSTSIDFNALVFSSSQSPQKPHTSVLLNPSGNIY